MVSQPKTKSKRKDAADYNILFNINVLTQPEKTNETLTPPNPKEFFIPIFVFLKGVLTLAKLT